ncbi:cation-transporting ATPase [Curtobacterium sp. MCJR17_055]|uniref:cation-transporting ATPase n=1 Tax=unclassified Curtobacterium TaxID=257496 RepID=UPI000D8C26F6|nr:MULTISPECIES: cation-transporting ATPase [unclassified Curtobacterium]PYY36229.1 cation-transporting ATPase [Curtobacterium sp. MCBD17_029]PYY54670.1 cation-transporting ATPase [Curtobacterium sp. MCJR17_055]PYY60905.1 cation-transporting ATPase [Curtobacterium sp. MCPF17_015]WIB35494.1 cation-transporting ATPase [Curtobacterium sp. MCJR17_043]
MANLNRILGMASKVIDKQLQKRSGQPGAGNQGGAQQPGGMQQYRQPGRLGGTDWRGLVRTAADRLTGDDRSGHDSARQPQQPTGQQPYGQPTGGRPARTPATDADRVAIAKYDYLLKTADPERLEQAHHDAFARLTPEQRQQVLQRLNAEVPQHDRSTDASPAGLARAATRGETSRPGTMRKVLAGTAIGGGALAVGGLAVAVAGGAVLSAAAGPVLAQAADLGVDFEGVASGLGDTVSGGLSDLGGGVEGVAAQGEQALGGLGDQVGNLGEGFQWPGIGDFFDR